jgi:SAM-dependent methyltransferase
MDWSWASELDDDDWGRFLAGALPREGHRAPALPSDEFQRSWVGGSGEIAFAEATGFVRRMKHEMAACGAPLQRSTRALDFACGWGRFYRVLMRDVDQIVGADPDTHCIQLCRQMLPGDDFAQIPPRPPYSFWDPASFDVVIAYSLFTHLAEPLARDILGEMARIIRPGGFLAFTVLPLYYIDIWERERNSGNYQTGIAQTDFDPNLWKARAQSGGFLYLPTGGGGYMTSDFYGWALISRSCLERLITLLPFTLTAMGPAGGIPQEFVLLQRQ